MTTILATERTRTRPTPSRKSPLLVSITRPYRFRRDRAKEGITISHKHNILASIQDRLSLLPKGLDVLLVKAMSRVIVRAMYHRNHYMKLGGCHFHNKASRLGLANYYVLALQTQAWAVRNLCGDPELTALIIALDFAIAARGTSTYSDV